MTKVLHMYDLDPDDYHNTNTTLCGKRLEAPFADVYTFLRDGETLTAQLHEHPICEECKTVAPICALSDGFTQWLAAENQDNDE